MEMDARRIVRQALFLSRRNEGVFMGQAQGRVWDTWAEEDVPT